VCILYFTKYFNDGVNDGAEGPQCLTQLSSSNFLGSVSSGGSGLALPLPFFPLAFPLLRSFAAFCFSFGAVLVEMLARALAGYENTF